MKKFKKFQPLLWEWLWLASCFLIYGIGSSAIKASKVDKMNIFLIVVLVALLVLLWGLGLHFSDAYAYMYEPHNKIYPTWKVNISKHIRSHSHMTSAYFWTFLTPSPLCQHLSDIEHPPK